jgi:hypothetical protein
LTHFLFKKKLKKGPFGTTQAWLWGSLETGRQIRRCLFVSTSGLGGGQEETGYSILSTLIHHGNHLRPLWLFAMLSKDLSNLDEVHGGTLSLFLFYFIFYTNFYGVCCIDNVLD